MPHDGVRGTRFELPGGQDWRAAAGARGYVIVPPAGSGRPNWPAVLQLHDALLAASPSLVVAINRALAVAEVHGAQAALAQLDSLAGDGRIREYQPCWAARADLLARTGAGEDARRVYEIAIGLERDPAVRRFLQRRAEHAMPASPTAIRTSTGPARSPSRPSSRP